MSRRHRRPLLSRTPFVSGDALGRTRTDHVDRASVYGIAPILLGIGFILSRVVAIAIADASALTFLWGLVIGLAFATAGIVFLISNEDDERARHPRTQAAQVPFAKAGGALVLSLLTGALLGIVL